MEKSMPTMKQSLGTDSRIKIGLFSCVLHIVVLSNLKVGDSMPLSDLMRRSLKLFGEKYEDIERAESLYDAGAFQVVDMLNKVVPGVKYVSDGDELKLVT